MMRIIRDLPPLTPTQRRRSRVGTVLWLVFMAGMLLACRYVYQGGW